MVVRSVMFVFRKGRLTELVNYVFESGSVSGNYGKCCWAMEFAIAVLQYRFVP